MSRFLKSKLDSAINKIQLYSNTRWYSPLIFFLSMIDNFILIIPVDGLLISSVLMRRQNWIKYAILISLGSTVGAFLLAALIEFQGLVLIMKFYPFIIESQTWIMMHNFFSTYGLFLVFFISVMPIAQQPAVVVAAISGVNIFQIVLVVFLGRLIKFIIISYVASHVPNLLNKLWGLKGEMKEVGIKTE